MAQQAVKTQGTTFKFECDSYLWTQAEAFLIDRKVQNLSAGTIRFYRIKLTLFLSYCDTQTITNIEQLTPDTLRSFLLWLETTGHNDSGRHAFYRTLKAFLNWWENENEPEGWKNPIKKVRGGRQSTELLDPIPMEDVKKLIDSCGRDWIGTRNRAIFYLLISSGVRSGELLATNLADVDLSGYIVDVRRGKGGKRRFTFFDRATKKAIRAWLKYRGTQPGALFITKSGDRLSYDGLRAVITRHAKLAGIPFYSAHAFRRQFTLSQLMAHVDPLSISRMLGHASTILVGRYAKQTTQDLHEKYKSPVDSSDN